MPIRRSPNGAHHVRPQPGRNRPEWVVAINRNAWSQSVGTGGRNHPVRAHVRFTPHSDRIADIIFRPLSADIVAKVRN